MVDTTGKAITDENENSVISWFNNTDGDNLFVRDWDNEAVGEISDDTYCSAKTKGSNCLLFK